MHSLSSLIERFFSDHLRAQRDLSIHTVSAYGDTFRLLLRFLSSIAANHRPARVRRLGRRFDPRFLNHLESARHNTARTRNARLARCDPSRAFPSVNQPPTGCRLRGASWPSLQAHCQTRIGFMDRARSPRPGFRRSIHALRSATTCFSASLPNRRPYFRDPHLHARGKGPLCFPPRKRTQGTHRPAPVGDDPPTSALRAIQPTSARQPLFANRHGATLTREESPFASIWRTQGEQACPSLHGARLLRTSATYDRHAPAPRGVPLEIIALGSATNSQHHPHLRPGDLNIKNQCATC